MEFKEKLIEYLELLDCTAKDLSDTSGLSTATISRYKSGDRVPESNSDNFTNLVKGIVEISKNKDIKSLTTKIGNDRETIIQRGLLSKLGIDSDITKEEFDTFRTDLEAEIVAIQAGIDQALSSVKKKTKTMVLKQNIFTLLFIATRIIK